MSRFHVALVLLALSGSACITTESAKKPRQPDEFRLADGTLVVCRMEADTGSNIRERVCRKVEGTTPKEQNDINRFLTPPPVNARTPN